MPSNVNEMDVQMLGKIRVTNAWRNEKKSRPSWLIGKETLTVMDGYACLLTEYDCSGSVSKLQNSLRMPGWAGEWIPGI